MAHVDYQTLVTNTRMTVGEIRRIWDAAAKIDGSLAIRQSKMTSKIAAKQVKPISYSRARLFEGMLSCKPNLFSNCPIRWRTGYDRRSTISRAVEEIRSGFPQAKRARVRTDGAVRYQTISFVLDKWLDGKSAFGVPDLHYIGTRFDRRVETSSLNNFNLLPRGTNGFESQDALVVSSSGAFTDSHSDDHSGSNHCFSGAKLWLVWDTFEGLNNGLEDVEHCKVYGQAAFDMETFLEMKTSYWFLIGQGQTIFLPVNFTHKVITLEKYLGLGNFNANLPGFVDSLIRWKQFPPIWASRSADGNPGSVGFITRRAIRKIKSLAEARRSERYQWGVPYLRMRLRKADVNTTEGEPGMTDVNLLTFIKAARHVL